MLANGAKFQQMDYAAIVNRPTSYKNRQSPCVPEVKQAESDRSCCAISTEHAINKPLYYSTAIRS